MFPSNWSLFVVPFRDRTKLWAWGGIALYFGSSEKKKKEEGDYLLKTKLLGGKKSRFQGGAQKVQ